MSNMWLKIKVWAKVTLVAVLLVYVLLFTYFNAQEKARFWYWRHHQPETNLLLLVLCSFLAGIVASFLVRTTFRTLRQVQEMRERSRAQRIDRTLSEIHAKAAMLQTRPPQTEPPEKPSSL